MNPNAINPAAHAPSSLSRDDNRLPAPNLFGFDYLFDDIKRTAGLPRDMSILVTGRPGAGKSFFTLSLLWEQIRALAAEGRQRRIADVKKSLTPPPEAGGKKGLIEREDFSGCALLYVGVQLDEEKVRQRFRDNGWPENAADVHVVTVRETDLPQPLPGAEEVVNAILSRLRALILSPRLRGKEHVFVMFDTITALLKASTKSGDRQRYMTELMAVTKSLLGERKALCAMVADTTDDPDDHVTLEKQVAPDYVFHLGFQESGGGRPARVFDVRKTSQLAPLLLGRHSWERVTRETLETVFTAKQIQKERLWAHRSKKPNGWSEVVLIPRPRVYDIGLLQDPDWNAPQKPQLMTIDPDLRLSCGVPGLDQMLHLDRRYWARPSLRILQEDYPTPGEGAGDGNSGLISGTVTFLLGRAGTGKTNCGLQFLLAGREPTKCLYVNFENRPHRVKQWYPGSERQKARLKGCHRLFRHRAHLNVNLLLCEIRYLVLKEKIERVVIDGLSDLVPVLDLKDYGRLVEELVHIIRLANVNAREDAPRINPVTIFITLEADPDDPGAKALELTDSPADNVVVFRQVTINDERRKTVEVRKARGQSPDKQVRELVVRKGEHYPLRVIPGLDNYHGLRSDHPEPVSIALQLIQENVAEGRCNARLVERLNSLYGYKVHPFGFARGEIVRTLLDIASGTDRIPFSDVKLFHIDEWWVRELRVKALREPGDLLAQSRHPLLRLNQFLAGDEREGRDGGRYSPMPADFWAVEMEKVCTPVVAKAPEPTAPAPADPTGAGGPKATGPAGPPARRPLRADVVALPSYTDYGIFCANRAAVGDRSWDARRWLNEVPRVWAVSDRGDWFEPPEPPEPNTSAKVIVDLMKAAAARDRIGFAYDMATPTTSSCLFLELCWAFGAAEEVFVRDTAKYAEQETDEARAQFVKDHAATKALKLLMYLVAEGLMPRRTTVLDVARAAFSRLWYSTIPDVDRNAIPNPRPADAPAGGAPTGGAPPAWNAVQPLRPEAPEAHRERNDKMFLLPLPFFPVGAAQKAPAATAGARGAAEATISEPLRIFLADTFARFDRWLDRLEAAVEYRSGLLLKTGETAREVRDAIEASRKVVRRWDRDEVRSTATGVAALLGDLRREGDQLRDALLVSPLFVYGRAYERERACAAFPASFLTAYPAPDTSGTQYIHLPYAMFTDTRDVREVFKWHDFRLKCAEAALADVPLGNVIFESAPDKPFTRPDGRVEAVSGFACEGAWGAGADHTTRSPNLSAKVLVELAAAENAADRAWAGAGIPARKDFFEQYGRQPVPSAPPHPEYNWQKFLVYIGSRSRRRTRAFCSRVELSAAFAEIDRTVFAGLDSADDARGDYRTARATAAAGLVRRAEQLAGDLFEWIADHMAEQCKRDVPEDVRADRPECVTCTNPGGCHQLLRRRSQG